MSRIGKSFQELFEPDRGDLVYGRSEQREAYTARLVGEKKGALDHAYWMIDEYNDAVGVSITSFNYKSPNDPTQIDRMRRQLGDDSNATDRSRRYLNLLAGSRFTPEAIQNIPQDKLMAEAAPKPTIAAKEHFAMYHKATRKACKFGIEYVVMHSPPQRLVHFILDGLGSELIQMASNQTVTKKSVYIRNGFQSQHKPITTSELLSVYRNWGTYQGRVLFYMDFKCVHPPWEQNVAQCPERETWAAYAADRYNRYRVRLRDSLGTAHAKTNRMQIENLSAQAEKLAGQGNYSGAAGLLKEAYHLAKDGQLPRGLSLYSPGAHLPLAPTGSVGESGKSLKDHVRSAIAAYEGRNLGIEAFQSRSTESKDALSRLKSILTQGNHRELHAAVNHYLGLTPAPALSAPLKTDSSLYAALTLEFGRWLFGNHYNRQFSI